MAQVKREKKRKENLRKRAIKSILLHALSNSKQMIQLASKLAVLHFIDS
jgi:hypothetical protein